MDRCLAELGRQRDNLRRTGRELLTMHDDVTDPIARKVARQPGTAGDAIAPPGTARRGALVLAGRGLKALPKLSSRRYVVHKIKMTLIRARGTLYLILRPYQIISGRLVRTLRPRERSLSSPLSSRFTIGWMSRSSSRFLTTVAIHGTVSSRSRSRPPDYLTRSSWSMTAQPTRRPRCSGRSRA